MLFVGRQDIINYWSFPPRFPKTVSEGWYRNLLDMISEMVVKMSLRDRLVRFALYCDDSACSLFPATTDQPVSQVCLPTLFAAVSTFFLPLTAYAISDAANSNNSALTRFPAGMIY